MLDGGYMCFNFTFAGGSSNGPLEHRICRLDSISSLGIAASEYSAHIFPGDLLTNQLTILSLIREDVFSTSKRTQDTRT